MRTKTHSMIAELLAKKIRLNKHLKNRFKKAMINPDRKYSPKYRHHNLRWTYSKILNDIMCSRIAFIKDDLNTCLYFLGKALHYVQDAYIISPSKKYGNKLLHDFIEREIEKLDIPIRKVEDGFNSAESSPFFIKRVIREIEISSDPKEVLEFALETSAKIVGAVFSSPNPPEDLKHNYKVIKRKHRRKYTLISIFIIILGIIIAFFIILSFGFLSGFCIFIFLLLISGIIEGMDKEYNEIKEMAEWYGIK